MATATQGWKFMMIGLRVADLERSLAFYRDVLGMEEVNRIKSDTVTIAFLGYPDNITTPDKMFQREGVLELVQAHEKSAMPLVTNANHNPEFGLIKLSFTVPDLQVAFSHLKAHDFKILKEPGQPGVKITARGIGISPDTSINKPVWEAVEPLVFAEDPDGYLIELIQQ